MCFLDVMKKKGERCRGRLGDIDREIKEISFHQHLKLWQSFYLPIITVANTTGPIMQQLIWPCRLKNSPALVRRKPRCPPSQRPLIDCCVAYTLLFKWLSSPTQQTDRPLDVCHLWSNGPFLSNPCQLYTHTL